MTHEGEPRQRHQSTEKDKLLTPKGVLREMVTVYQDKVGSQGYQAFTDYGDLKTVQYWAYRGEPEAKKDYWTIWNRVTERMRDESYSKGRFQATRYRWDLFKAISDTRGEDARLGKAKTGEGPTRDVEYMVKLRRKLDTKQLRAIPNPNKK